ncbi:MAG: hypothetical protein QM820_17020 [Minicystis sp.]
MSWSLEWEAAAEEALKRLPSWQAAARVSRAVIEFAHTGQGDFRQVGEGPEYRLYVGAYVVRLGFDTRARIIHVWGVFPRG